RLGGVERAAADEDAEPRENGFAGVVEQVVAPLDRVPQRALAVPRSAAGQEREALLPEPVEDLRRRQQLDACRRELERERDSLQPTADLGDRGGVIVDQLVRRLR